MILTVLALGGAVLGATTIAGLLMLYQIRETTDLANSAKAIYAADAGIEWSLYKWFKDPSPPAVSFTNRATVLITQSCLDKDGLTIDPCDSASPAVSVTFKSKGTSGNSNRAFGLTF